MNTFLITNFVDYLIKNHGHLQNKYFCEILHKTDVSRDRRNKYFLTCEENNKKYHDDYCCGVANLITSDLIPRLYNATFTAKSFWVDDMYEKISFFYYFFFGNAQDKLADQIWSRDYLKQNFRKSLKS